MPRQWQVVLAGSGKALSYQMPFQMAAEMPPDKATKAGTKDQGAPSSVTTTITFIRPSTVPLPRSRPRHRH